jgi:hypothetical protein
MNLATLEHNQFLQVLSGLRFIAPSPLKEPLYAALHNRPPHGRSPGPGCRRIGRLGARSGIGQSDLRHQLGG